MNSGIIRAVKDRDHPYIITNKTFALDARLSFEARGMLIYLLAQPDDWQVQTNDLIKQSPAARDKVYRILNELESLGYLLREQERDEHGRYIRQITTVYEVPQIPDPITEKPETGLLNTEKAELNKYRVLPSNESTKEREALAPQDATTTPKKKRERNGAPPLLTSLPEQGQQAIRFYQAAFGRFPNDLQMQMIAERISDLDRWQQVLVDWQLYGWNKTNVGGMLARYEKPQESQSSAPPDRTPIKMPHILWMTEQERSPDSDRQLLAAITRAKQNQYMTPAQLDQFRAAGMPV